MKISKRATGHPHVISNLPALRRAIANFRSRGRTIALVPTMGALHDGHVALLRRAAELSQPNGSVVVSVFVNPLQFGAGEDLDRYPRDLDADMAICEREGVALVFAPGVAQIYP
ncbi:MAG TPA: pantoate--beta-alanine ligase, partial [Xanthobacteraceae bacterium]